MAEANTFTLLGLALLGGMLPPLVWLWFWLKEDARRPEPRGLIVLSFLSGLIAVVIAIVLGHPIHTYLDSFSEQNQILLFQVGIIIFAAIEELAKYGVAYLIALRSRFFDEPIDAMIYLIAVALGFAAFENGLYLLSILFEGDVFGALTNIHLRFLGATLLHVVSSAAVGFAIGISYRRHKEQRLGYVVFGLLTATALHALFNLSIIQAQTLSDKLAVFGYYWIAVLGIILAFEKLRMRKRVRVPRRS